MALKKIGKVVVDFPQFYQIGHVLTPGELSQLEQVRRENIANNLRKEGEAVDVNNAEEVEAFKAKALDTWQKYEMGVRVATSRGVATVESEVRRIARNKCTSLLRKQKKQSPKEYGLEAFEKKVDAFILKNQDKLEKIAKVNLLAAKEVTSTELEF